jgi:hypothetical protein
MAEKTPDIGGMIRGGQQPVAHSTIQLYTVGTTGDGSAATPLLTSTVTSDANGNFTFAGLFSCSDATLTYLTATGGDPGLGQNNPNLSMMATVGPCSSITSNTFITINEETTVAAVSALAPFMNSPSTVGSAPANAAALAGAFLLALELVNPAAGIAPGLNVPSGVAVPIMEMNTLADILSACVNSTGGVAGDSTACGNLFSLTTPANGAPPTDTALALLDLANNPGLNTGSLFALVPATAPFQPQLAVAPPDFQIRLTPPAGSMALQMLPANVSFPATAVGSASSSQTVTIQNTGSTQVALSGIGITGSNASDFTQTNTCTAALSPNGSCTVQLTATPGAPGLRNGYVSVTSNAPDSPQYIPLSVLGVMSASAIAGASAEYPMDDGTGTTVRDISGNGNNAAFATGPNAPSWLPYGIAFLNASETYSNNNQWIDTPLTTFGTAYVAYCTPTAMPMNTGTDGFYAVAAAPTLIGSSSSSSGIFLAGSNLSQFDHLSVVPSIFDERGVTNSTANQVDGGCHIYAFSVGSSRDRMVVDGVETPYVQQGDSGPVVSTTGHYQLGTGQGNDSNLFLRGVISYVVFFPASHTVAEMTQETSYIAHQLSLRANYPTYPVSSTATTSQWIGAGDSLTAGFDGSSQWTSGLTFDNPYTVSNYGIGGIEAIDVCNMADQRWAPSVVPSKTIVQVWAGTNDFARGKFNADQVWASLSACAVKAKQYGARSIVATMISRTGWDASKNALNALIRANYQQAGFDYLNDIAAAPELGADGASSNTACFKVDETHLTGPGPGGCGSVQGVSFTGYGIVEQLSENAVNTMDGSTATNPDRSTSNAFVSAYRNNYVVQTPTADATFQLVDCQGQSSPRVVVNGSSMFTITVSTSGGWVLIGSPSVLPNSSATFMPSVVSSAAGGCQWTRQ